MEIVYSSKVFIVSLVFSAIGIKLMFDGIRGDVPKIFTTLKIPDGVLILIVGGVICQVPTLLYVYAAL